MLLDRDKRNAELVSKARNDVLDELEQWLLNLDPKKHYVGFELDFGIDRDEVLGKIQELRGERKVTPLRGDIPR